MWVHAIVGTAAMGGLVLSGCSSPSSSNRTGNTESGAGTASLASGGGGSAAQGGSGNHAGAVSGGPPSGDGGTSNTATNPEHFGQVMVQSLVGTVARVSVNARFVSGSGPGSPTSCTSTSDGPCQVSVCDVPPADAPATLFASAGTITVTSTEVSGTATLEPDATGEYPVLSDMVFSKAFVGGEHLQINAAGAAVPAFKGELSVPLVLLVSQPVFGEDDQVLQIARSQDLSLVWSRGVKDVVFYATGGGARADGLPGSARLTCQLPSETGSVVIKASLLQLLAAKTRLTAYTVGTKLTSFGDYSITLAATLPLANPDKVLMPGFLLE